MCFPHLSTAAYNEVDGDIFYQSMTGPCVRLQSRTTFSGSSLTPKKILEALAGRALGLIWGRPQSRPASALMTTEITAFQRLAGLASECGGP